MNGRCAAEQSGLVSLWNAHGPSTVLGCIVLSRMPTFLTLFSKHDNFGWMVCDEGLTQLKGSTSDVFESEGTCNHFGRSLEVVVFFA